MELNSAVPAGSRIVDAYFAGGFQVGGQRISGSLIILPDRVIPWAVAAVDDISLESLAPVRDADPPVDVLLIGCGARMALLPSALRRSLREWGLTADMMDTTAACRTFNVLVSENRRAAAALIAL